MKIRDISLLFVLAAPAAGQRIQFLDRDLGAGHVGAHGQDVLFRAFVWSRGVFTAIPAIDGNFVDVSGDGRTAVFVHYEEDPKSQVSTYSGQLLDVRSGQVEEYGGLPFCVIPSGSGTLYYPLPKALDHAGRVMIGARHLAAIVDGPFGPFQTCEDNGAYLELDDGVWREAPDGSQLFCISGDGRRVGGRDGDDSPALYDISGDGIVAIPLGFEAPIYGRVDALSDDGSRARIVTQEVSGVDQRWWWSEQEGLISISPDASGELATADFCIAIDRDIVWEEETAGSLPTADFLAAHGIDAFVDEWTLLLIGGVDSHGRIFSGVARPTAGGDLRSFVASLPAGRRYGLFLGDANTLALYGDDPAVLGGALQLVVEHTPGSLVAFYLATDFATQPFLGGTLLVDPESILALRFATSGDSGVASLQTPIPFDPSLEGLKLYTQAVSPDATQDKGWALSNGVRLMVGSSQAGSAPLDSR